MEFLLVGGALLLLASLKRQPEARQPPAVAPPPPPPPAQKQEAPPVAAGGGGGGGALGAGIAIGAAVGAVAGEWFHGTFNDRSQMGATELSHTSTVGAWTGAGALVGGVVATVGLSAAAYVAIPAVVVAAAISQWVTSLEIAARHERWSELFDQVQAELAAASAEAGPYKEGASTDRAWKAWGVALQGLSEGLPGLGFRLEGGFAIPQTVVGELDGKQVRVKIRDHLTAAYRYSLADGDREAVKVAAAIPWLGGSREEERDGVRVNVHVGNPGTIIHWAEVQGLTPELTKRGRERMVVARLEAKIELANSSLREELRLRAADAKGERDWKDTDTAVSGRNTGATAY